MRSLFRQKRFLLIAIIMIAILGYTYASLAALDLVTIQLTHLVLFRLTFFTAMGFFSLVGATLSFKKCPNAPISTVRLFWLFVATMILAATELIATLGGQRDLSNFYISAFAAGIIASLHLAIGLRCLRFKLRFELRLVLVPFVTTLLILIARVVYGSLIPIAVAETLIGGLTIGTAALLPIIAALLITNAKHLKRDPQSLANSIRLTLFPPSGSHPQVALFYGLVAINVCGYLLYLAMAEPLDGRSGFPLYASTLSFIPCLLYCFFDLGDDLFESQKSKTLASLTPSKAIRFFMRHQNPDQDQWAATVGLRTANFTIDHDPSNDAGKRLTATLSHIRRDEIKNFTEKILGPKLLSNKALGNQLIGTIDPEESTRSCVDVLILFATVYLDVVPLVERRLKGLSALFPIIDPELAKIIQPHNIEASHAKLEWLYYLDFQWVDQQFVLSGDYSAYSVNIEGFNSLDRAKVLIKLQQKNRTGNFIWVSEASKERIQMEAPYLASIIEAWSIDSEEGAHIVYLIKFEDLIPRLQKYYALERIRTTLRDYEFNDDSKRILNMISLQFNRKLTKDIIFEIVAMISSYDWQGFKEKDVALSYVLKAYQCLMSLAERQLEPITYEEYSPHFLKAIEDIGFPSQLLYEAHRSKRSIRNMSLIISTAKNPHHPRFSDAWLYACSTEPTIYSREETDLFMGCIDHALATETLKKNAIIHHKILAAFLNFCKILGPEDFDSLRTRFLKISNLLLDGLDRSEAWSSILDGKAYLETIVKRPLELDEYFEKLRHDAPDTSDPARHLSA